MEAQITSSLPTVDDQMSGRPNADFTECEGCVDGIVERVADDYDGDTGRIGYQYLNGSASIDGSALCAKCAAAEVLVK